MTEDQEEREEHLGRNGAVRRVPEWLIGLVIAAVIFVLLYLFQNQLGIGDDPAMGLVGGLVPTFS